MRADGGASPPGNVGRLSLQDIVANWDECVDDHVSLGKAWSSASAKDKSLALHFAAHQGDTPLLRWMLDSGTDPDIRDGQGSTPLIVASAQDQIDSVSMLLQYGAEIGAQNRSGQTALTVASSISCEQILLEASKYVGKETDRGMEGFAKTQPPHGRVVHASGAGTFAGANVTPPGTSEGGRESPSAADVDPFGDDVLDAMLHEQQVLVQHMKRSSAIMTKQRRNVQMPDNSPPLDGMGSFCASNASESTDDYRTAEEELPLCMATPQEVGGGGGDGGKKTDISGRDRRPSPPPSPPPSHATPSPESVGIGSGTFPSLPLEEALKEGCIRGTNEEERDDPQRCASLNNPSGPTVHERRTSQSLVPESTAVGSTVGSQMYMSRSDLTYESRTGDTFDAMHMGGVTADQSFEEESSANLIVYHPNDSTSVRPGSILHIQWDQRNRYLGEGVRIELNKFNMGIFVMLVSNDTPNTGAYNWVVPEDLPPGKNYRIYVMSTDAEGCLGSSTGYFSVTPAPIASYGTLGGGQGPIAQRPSHQGRPDAQGVFVPGMRTLRSKEDVKTGDLVEYEVTDGVWVGNCIVVDYNSDDDTYELILGSHVQEIHRVESDHVRLAAEMVYRFSSVENRQKSKAGIWNRNIPCCTSLEIEPEGGNCIIS